MPAQPLTTEFKDFQLPSSAEIPVREHDAFARARKVITGPLMLAPNASGSSNLPPTQVALTAASASMPMKANQAYRLVVSAPAYFRLTKGAGAAVVGDVYLSADQPVIIKSDGTWDTVSVIAVAAAGIAQIAAVL